MTTDDIRAAVLKALSDIAPEIDTAAIKTDVPLRDQVDLDSMDLLNFLIAVDEALCVEIPESDYARIATIDALVLYVDQRLASGPRAS